MGEVGIRERTDVRVLLLRKGGTIQDAVKRYEMNRRKPED